MWRFPARRLLFPGLHPDGFEEADSGWPRVLKRFPTEAWRRAGAGELADEELYPSDAAWSGLYDRMHTHEPDEMERRFALAADCGEMIFSPPRHKEATDKPTTACHFDERK